MRPTRTFLRDTAIHISSPSDGNMEIEADTLVKVTAPTQITGDLTLDGELKGSRQSFSTGLNPSTATAAVTLRARRRANPAPHLTRGSVRKTYRDYLSFARTRPNHG